MIGVVKKVLEDNAPAYSNAMGISESEFKASYENIPDKSMQVFFKYECDHGSPDYQKDYGKAYNNLKVIYGPKAEMILKILGGSIAVAKERSKPIRIVSRKVVRKPVTRVMNVRPKIADVLKINREKTMVDGPKIIRLVSHPYTKKVLTPVETVTVRRGDTDNEDKATEECKS